MTKAGVKPTLFWIMLAPIFLRAQQPAPQGVPENAVQRVSDHVYAILGFPNIGIIVGDRAALVVDTGMGPPNGAIVAREAAKLAKGRTLYLTTTHFHPEHASGAQAFPAGTILIRPSVQQQELESHGAEFIQMFSSRSPVFREQLKDVKPRPPDILFDREITLDLGGATARLMWFGPGHTLGDELIFIEPDRTLLPGDIVENKLVPGMPNADSSPKGWLALLDKIAPLQPRYIVPDHGTLGDGSLVAQERGFLQDLQTRALSLKQEGVSVDDAGRRLETELKAKYPDWGSPGGIPNIVRRVYAEDR